MTTPHDIVKIVWTDALSVDAWTDIHEIERMDLPLIETVGYLIHESDERFAVALNVDSDNGNVSNVILIPKANIQSGPSRFPSPSSKVK